MAFCTGCGSSLRSGSAFCPQCGRPVNSSDGASGTADDWPAATSPWRASRRAATAVVAVVVAVLLVGVVWAASGTGQDGTSAGPAAPPSAPPDSASRTPPTATPSTTPGPVPSTGRAAERTVTLVADASRHPAADQVRDLLQRHFDAINDQDYDAWATTVTGARASAIPREVWLRGYRSTKDDSVVVNRISAGLPPSLTVDVSFASTQDPADAPADLPVPRICWTQQLVVDANGDARISRVTPGSTSRQAC